MKLLGLWGSFSRRFGVGAGCFLFCLKEAFLAVDGFSEKVYASEEVWFSIAVSKWGRARRKRFVIIEEPRVITSTRKADHMIRALLAGAIIVLMPFSLRFRFLSWFWYPQHR